MVFQIQLCTVFLHECVVVDVSKVGVFHIMYNELNFISHVHISFHNWIYSPS